MRSRFYSTLTKIIRVFVVKSRIEGLQKLFGRPCMICVANHLGSFGPMAIMSTFRTMLYPWVIHQVTDIRIREESRWLGMAAFFGILAVAAGGFLLMFALSGDWGFN